MSQAILGLWLLENEFCRDDYLRQLDDPLKLAIGVALANDEVLTNLDKNNALRNISAKIKSGQVTALTGQGQVFDSALVRIGRFSQTN